GHKNLPFVAAPHPIGWSPCPLCPDTGSLGVGRLGGPLGLPGDSEGRGVAHIVRCGLLPVPPLGGGDHPGPPSWLCSFGPPGTDGGAAGETGARGALGSRGCLGAFGVGGVGRLCRLPSPRAAALAQGEGPTAGGGGTAPTHGPGAARR